MNKKILWLSSWYPNPVSPYDGDFIQRHAKATALYLPITVFYVAQFGENVLIHKDRFIENDIDNVKERIILFRFKKIGFPWIDKFIYNIRYYRFYKKTIRAYFRKKEKPDIVHVHVPVKAGWIGVWIHRRWGIPCIVSEHSSLYNTEAPDNFFEKNIFHRQLVKKIFRSANAVTNVSATVGKMLGDLFQLPEVKTIHNTVNTLFFNYKPKLSAKFRFIHVSTLTHQKNPEGILNAIGQLKKKREDFEFVFVGPSESRLKKISEELELKSFVSFTGEISYPEVAIQMQQASAFVLFSRHENFPCVMIEALCCGLPFIGTDVGGVAEAINDSNGIIISSESEVELLSAMNAMMNGYYKFGREKIALDAQQKYSYAAIGKQFNDLYNEILKPG